MRLRQAALPGLALLLAGLWGMELSGRGPASLTLPPGRVPAASGAIGTPAGEIAAWQAVILGRPLFAEDRRPPPAAGNAGLARLAAIIIAGGNRCAIFAPAGGKPQIVPEGGAIGGYRLSRIGPDWVALDGAAGRLLLHPAFAAAPSAPGAAAGPQSDLAAAPPPLTGPTVPPPGAPPSAIDYDNEH